MITSKIITRKKLIKHEPSEVNQYFGNLPANLTSKQNIESSYETSTNNLPTENCCHSFLIRHTNYTGVCEIIASLKNGSSSADDVVYKTCCWFIRPSLVHIVNTLIDKKFFPKQWKIWQSTLDPQNGPTNWRKGLPTSFSIARGFRGLWASYCYRTLFIYRDNRNLQ